MRRLVWTSGAVLLGAVLLVALAFWLVPRDRLQTRIAEQIAAWTGRDVSSSGDPEIDFFPAMTVTLSDVVIGGPPTMSGANVLTMRQLIGEVRIFPLLLGDVEIGSFTLVQPEIRLIRDTRGERNWEFDSGAAALQLAFAGDVPLGDFQVIDGTISYDNAEAGISERFDDVDLEIEWESVRRPMAASGSAQWRGEAVSVTARADEPFAFINRRETPVSASFESGPLRVELSGSASDVSNPRFDGDLEAATPSFRRFLQWMGNGIGEGQSLGAASLQGRAEFSGGTLSVADAEVVLDQNRANGALTMTPGDKPFLSGTLAFETLDLSPYFSGVRSKLAEQDDWRAFDFRTDWLAAFEADVRLSAAGIQAGPVAFGATAATLSLRDARLALGLAESELYGGNLSGELSLAEAESGALEAKAQLQAQGADLADFSEQAGWPPLTGTADLALNLASGGMTLGGLYDELRGSARVEIVDGSGPGIGVAQVAAAVRAGDPSLVSAPLGTVPFQALSASLTIAGGKAGLDRATIREDGLSAELSGAIGLSDGALDLQGVIDLDGVGAPVPFVVGGTIADPWPALTPLAN